MKTVKKRKICFPILNRAYYGRRKPLLKLLKNHPSIDLQLIIGSSMLLDKYSSKLYTEIEDDGFNIFDKLLNVVDGGNHLAMAKTAGLVALDITNSLYKLDPNIVIVDGDRFEQLAIAMAAAYLNKTLIHIEGGDVSGNIDESVRHAVTKLSHIHFVTNKDSRQRVVKMGENPDHVFNVGSLDVEHALSINKKIDNNLINNCGVGAKIDIAKPFLMVIHHPETASRNNRHHTDIVLRAASAIKMPTIWFWPNNDAGTNEVAEAIRHFREHHQDASNKFRFITNLPPDDFVALLKKTTCLIGNSSVGIKECSCLGIPVVNIGNRQQGRLRDKNVVDVSYDHDEIKKSIEKQLKHGGYPPSTIYYRPNTSRLAVNILKRVKLYTQKNFYKS